MTRAATARRERSPRARGPLPRRLTLHVWMEEELVTRLDAVVERLRENPENVAMRVNRASLLRVFIVRGLDQFERDPAFGGELKDRSI